MAARSQHRLASLLWMTMTGDDRRESAGESDHFVTRLANLWSQPVPGHVMAGANERTGGADDEECQCSPLPRLLAALLTTPFCLAPRWLRGADYSEGRLIGDRERWQVGGAEGWFIGSFWFRKEFYRSRYRIQMQTLMTGNHNNAQDLFVDSGI